MNLNASITFFSFIVILLSCQNVKEDTNTEVQLKSIYVGTYTRTEGHVDGKAKGIYQLSLDHQGALKVASTAAKMVNPSFVATDSQNKYLYAVSETGAEDGKEGSLHSFKIASDGQLTKIDSVGTGGFYPCHVTTNRAGNIVIAANYVGGAVTLYSVEKGKLTVLQKLTFEGDGVHWRQDASHTHMSTLSPDENFLYVVDLGANVIWNLRRDKATGLFVENERQVALALPENAGPRHMDFHPEGKLAAVISELNNSISLLSFSKESGVLEILATKNTLGSLDSANSNATADIHFHPNGKFVYGSNRGLNTISVFEVLEGSNLSLIQEVSTQGEFPRNFALTEDGSSMWVANQNTDNISVYEVDAMTGQLSYSHMFEDIMTPVCITGL